MFKTIIVGVDARDGGRDALALASALAQTGGGELVAVHAYPYDYYVSRGDADFDAVMHGAAMETLEGELERTRVRARPVAVPDSSPARALHLAAKRHDGDLIVVGSAHRGRLGRVLAGDDAAGTLHGSPCPVVVAPAGWAQRDGKKLETIGVGYDGSPESRAALGLARELAAAAGARLRVIEVVVPPEPGGPFPAYRPDWTEHARIRREEAERRIEDVVAELGEVATGDVAFGDPSRELAYEGNYVDLLVTGSRNYGPIRRLILGSTSGKLVHEAPCPVLVTTRSVEDEGESAAAGSAAAHAS